MKASNGSTITSSNTSNLLYSEVQLKNTSTDTAFASKIRTQKTASNRPKSITYKFKNKIKNFKQVVEDLLDQMLIDLGSNYEQFLETAKYGLESPAKKYFEQIIACDNYIYFKSLMVKRNLQLEAESYALMYKQMTKAKDNDVPQIMMQKGKNCYKF